MPLGWQAEAANLNDDNTVAPAINPSLGKWKGRDEISFTVHFTKTDQKSGTPFTL